MGDLEQEPPSHFFFPLYARGKHLHLRLQRDVVMLFPWILEALFAQ